MTKMGLKGLFTISSKLIFWDHLQISRSNILWRPDKSAEGKADCAASIGGISTFHKPPACLPQSGAGVGKESFDERPEHPRLS
jgi:hypothetical protein